jgi:hypothetical protein
MRKKNWWPVPDGRLAPRQTGLLTVGSKLTSTSTAPVLAGIPSGTPFSVETISRTNQDQASFTHAPEVKQDGACDRDERLV